MNPIELLKDLDGRLAEVVATHGLIVFGLLGLAILVQTAVVVGPVLPGNPVVFAAGLVGLQALGWGGLVVLWVAYGLLAGLGNLANYGQGRFLGDRLRGKGPFQERHFVRAEAFFSQHGRKATLLAMFVPFVRSFAPFVAGVGRMAFGPFALFSLLGGFLWTGVFLLSGAALGQVPAVRENLGLAILAVFVLVTAQILWKTLRRPRATPNLRPQDAAPLN